MDGSSPSPVLPLLLLLAVLTAVALALYFTLVGGEANTPKPVKPEEVPGPIEQPEDPVEPPPVRPDRPIPPRPGPAGVRRIHGTVVLRDGTPAEGATVSAFPAQPPVRRAAVDTKEQSRRELVAELYQYFPDESESLFPLGTRPKREVEAERPVAETVTNAGGEFRFESRIGSRVRLVARLEQLTSREEIAIAGRPVVLEVAKATTLVGWVRSETDGRPIENAAVTLSYSTRGAGSGREIDTTSDKGGRFEFTGLRPGQVMILASHPEYAGALQKGILLTGGESREVQLKMSRGYTLTVNVSDFDAEEEPEPPVPGATVAGIRLEDDGYFVTTADANGKAVIEGLPPGTYVLNGRAKGFLDLGEERLQLSGDMEYEMLLEEAVYTVVRVLDDRGVPIPGATLWSGDPDEEFHERISKKVGTTNAAGECEFPFEFDGPRAVLYVKKAGYGMGVVYPDDPSEGGDYEIRLDKGRTLHGRVVDESGEPVEGALVYIEVTQEDAEAEDLYASVFTDADGKYEFDYLAPGEVWIEVELDGYEGDGAEFEVTGGQSQYVRNFKIVKE